MSILPVRAGYARWAPGYEAETPVSFLENHIAETLAPAPVGGRLLDAACGTGRRSAATPARSVGVDQSLAMLRAGGRQGRVAAADLRALPFPDASFEMVWCRLAIGHLPEPADAYAELARVCDDRGLVFVSDFHPTAALRGHRRAFRDAAGVRHEIEHYIHSPGRQVEAAARSGLELRAEQSGLVGPLVEPFYQQRGMAAEYTAQVGLPLVLALLFQRRARK